MATSDWSDFLTVEWLTMEHISILLPPDYILKKQNLLTLRDLQFYVYVLQIGVCPLYFFFWPLCYMFFFNIRILITPLIIFKLFFTPDVWWGPCCSSIQFSCFVVCPMLAVFLDCPFLIALSVFHNVSLMTFSISENKNIKMFHRKHQFQSTSEIKKLILFCHDIVEIIRIVAQTLWTKTQIYNLVRFYDTLHQVHSETKDWKAR